MGKTSVMKFGTRWSAGRFEKQANSISRIGLLIAGLMLWPLQPAYMALITQDSPINQVVSTPGGPELETLLNYNIQNNDNGTTYDSATVDFDLILGQVADHISANSINPAYAGKTRAEIIGSWNPNIRQVSPGEVYTDWFTYVDGNNDQVIQNAGGPAWTDTTQNSGNQDLMAITLDLNDSLDLNNNGAFDAATESLLITTTQVPAFEAQLTTLSSRTGNMNTYAVIPEPGTLWLTMCSLLAGLTLPRLRRARG